MLQVRLQEPGRFELGEVPDLEPRPGEALVRVRRIGVCGTDLHAFKGRQPFFTYPRVLGHELAGEILAVEENEWGLAVGSRVAIEPYLACGECRPCRAGRYNCCGRLEVLGVHCDGGMQEALSVPLHLLHASEVLSLEQLALIETLGIGYHAVERSQLQPEEWALIIGAGPIGLATLQFACLAGAQVVVLDLSESRREFALRMGATQALAPTEDTLADLVEVVGPELASCVFDATGNLGSMSRSLTLAGSGGRVVMVGLAQGTFAVDDPLFHRRELSIHSSRNSAGAFPALIRLMEEGRLDTSLWVTHRMELGSVPDQFPGLYDPSAKVLKAMITADA